MTVHCADCLHHSAIIVEGGAENRCKGLGDCRRNAPRGGDFKPWPLTRDNWWCGEGEPYTLADGERVRRPPPNDLKDYVPIVMDVIG